MNLTSLFKRRPDGQDFARIRQAVRKLMARTFISRSKLCVVGDSFVQENGSLALGNHLYLGGCVTVLNVFAKQAFDFGPSDIFSKEGGTLVNILEFLPDIIGLRYEFCVVQGCHNDQMKGRSTLASKKDYLNIVTALVEKGILPIICQGTPNDSVVGRVNQISLQEVQAMTLEMNVWKRGLCSQVGLPLWNWFDPCVSDSLLSCKFRDGWCPDNVHPGTRAHWAIAKQGMTDLEKFIPTTGSGGSSSFQKRAELNLLAAPEFIVSEGGVDLGKFQFRRFKGTAEDGGVISERVCSDDKAGHWQQFTFSKVAFGTTHEIWLYETSLNQEDVCSVGDHIEMSLEVEFLQNSPFRGFEFEVIDVNKNGSESLTEKEAE